MTTPVHADAPDDHDQSPGVTSDRRRFLAGGAMVAAAAATAAVGAAFPEPAGAVAVGTSFYFLPSPKRVYDTRPGQVPVSIGPKAKVLGGRNDILLTVNGSGVPASGVTGVMVSLTITNTSAVPGSFLAIFKNGIAFPGTSSINWFGANQTLAVTTVTAVDSASKVALFASSSTDLIIDVLGYYAP